MMSEHDSYDEILERETKEKLAGILFADEENNFYRVDYSTIKDELHFKYNDEEYILNNDGIFKEKLV